ncbi:MAG: hypothetical protein PHV59_06015 [Victivallales bacterium]|nr:hypothetical protein [Victivallales bacterium]
MNIGMTFSQNLPQVSDAGGSCPELENIIEKNVHAVLWEHFIDPRTDMMYEFRDLFRRDSLLPSPEEVRQEIPNPAGWVCGFEDCCLNGSMYLAGLLAEFIAVGSPFSAIRMKKIFAGLMHLAGVSETKGFLARGVLPDGRTHYPNSSVDQYTMWLYVMWRYFTSGIAPPEEREKIVAAVTDMLRFIEAGECKIRREDGKESIFGDIDRPEGRRRLLFFLKVGYVVTGDIHWQELYVRKRDENDTLALKSLSRKGLQQHGIIFGLFQDQLALRGLYELSDNFREASVYRQAMQVRAETVAQVIDRFDNFRGIEFDGGFDFDWRRDLDEFIRRHPDQTKNLTGNRISEFSAYWWSKRKNLRQLFRQVRESVEALAIQLLTPDMVFSGKHREIFCRILNWEKLPQCFWSSALAYIPLLYWLERGNESILGADLSRGEFLPVDLRAHCNVGFRDERDMPGWLGAGTGDDLRDIKTGTWNCGGIPFHIIGDTENTGRTCIALKGNTPDLKQPPYLDQASGIRVDSTAKYIFFLHTMGCSIKLNSGTYRIVYEDGEVIDVPLTYGENIMPWKLSVKNWQIPGNTLTRIGIPRPTSTSLAESDREVFIYAWRWINPRPCRKIDHFDFIRSELDVPPTILLAATVFKSPNS